MSPQYQETVTLGDKIAGKQRITDTTNFIFPSTIRIAAAKHVTFHYVKGTQAAESRLHQLIRPHLWRWLTIAMSDGPFTHLFKSTWEGDHTNLFQKLMEVQNEQREETDQVLLSSTAKCNFVKRIPKTLYKHGTLRPTKKSS